MPSMCDKSTFQYCKTHAVEKAVVSKAGDMVLPDYYPDAAEVLSAYADFYVRETEMDGKRLTVKGSVRCTVIYQAEGTNLLQSVTDISDFEKGMEFAEGLTEPFLTMKAETVYISGRMNNSRKLSYSAEGMIEVTVRSNVNAQVVIAGDNIEAVGEKRMITSMAASGSKRIRMEEDVEIPSSKPQLATLLSVRQSTKLIEQKTVSNKIVTKGAMMLHLVYASVDGALETMESEIPFNQILDMDGVDEGCSIWAELMPMSLKTEMYENDSGENRILALEAELMLSAAAYRNVEVMLCKDAYLLGYESEAMVEKLAFMEMGAENAVERPIRNTVNFDESIERVMTFGGMLSSMRPEMVEGTLKMTGSLFVSMIVQLEAGGLKCLEAAIPVMSEMGGEVMGVSAQLDNAGYTLIDSHSVEIRASVMMKMLVSQPQQAQIVSDLVTADPPVAVPRNDYIVLYYPDDNESFWEIGKKFRIGETVIKLANGFENEDCPKRMVLIPRK